MAKAIATYSGGHYTAIQMAVREDGVLFERHEEKSRYTHGYQWTKWKHNGWVKIDAIPEAMYEYASGREISKDDSPGNYRLPND